MLYLFVCGLVSTQYVYRLYMYSVRLFVCFSLPWPLCGTEMFKIGIFRKVFVDCGRNGRPNIPKQACVEASAEGKAFKKDTSESCAKKTTRKLPI